MRHAARPVASVDGALRFAARLERTCSRVLGDELAGVILHGSLTLADFVPGRSDVDLLAVVEDQLAEAQLTELAEAVARMGRTRRRESTCGWSPGRSRRPHASPVVGSGASARRGLAGRGGG